jgi:hypothetical protein
MKKREELKMFSIWSSRASRFRLSAREIYHAVCKVLGICPLSHAVDQVSNYSEIWAKKRQQPIFISPTSRYSLYRSTGGLSYEAVNMVVRACQRVEVFAESGHRHRMKTMYNGFKTVHTCVHAFTHP